MVQNSVSEPAAKGVNLNPAHERSLARCSCICRITAYSPTYLVSFLVIEEESVPVIDGEVQH
jgi:hypothetical protein